MLSSQLDTEFCRTLLHEQLKKLNLPDPSYSWKKSGEGPESTYEGTVEIVGTDYVGGPAKSKKRAAIKAARTALLAIQGQHCKSNTEVVDAHSGTKREREVEQHAGGQNNEANKKRNIENASATDLKDEQSHLQHEMCVDDGQKTNAAEVLNYQDTSRKREDEEMVHRTKERAKESREEVVPSLEEIGGQLTKPVAELNNQETAQKGKGEMMRRTEEQAKHKSDEVIPALEKVEPKIQEETWQHRFVNQ